jgi:CPA2 family monovalent cation:H+ antiporter-2
LPQEGRDLVLAGAIISILLNPFLFSALDWLLAREEAPAPPPEPVESAGPREPVKPTALKNHVVLVGHGKVGKAISQSLRKRKIPLFVVVDDEDEAAELRGQGVGAIAGNAADPEIIEAASLGAARSLLVAIADGFEGGQVVEQARAINPKLNIVARAHSEEEILHLMRHGASHVVMAEREIAVAMVDRLARASI